MIQGRCLCGALRYEFDEPLQHLVHCHCSMCRKHHGAPFASFAAAPLHAFRWKQGEAELRHYESSPGTQRPFCARCGSVGPQTLPAWGMAAAPAGNLEGALGLEPQLHLFVGSRAPWYEIGDALPQHRTWPPEWGDRAPERPAPELTPGRTSGSCLCGAQRFELEGPARVMWNCHCSRCRLARSAAHACNLVCAPEQLRWTREAEPRREYRPPDARYFTTVFCTRCGCKLPRLSPERGLAIVPAGALDSDPGVRPAGHIFVGSKASWFAIHDALPQYAEAPPAA